MAHFSSASPILILAAGLMAGCGTQRSLQCGVYSLTEVLRTKGVTATYAQVQSNTVIANGDVSMSELQRVAHNFGLPLVGVRFEKLLDICKYDGIILELIDNHFIAVLGCPRTGFFHVADSSTGHKEWSAARLESEWTGRALVAAGAIRSLSKL